MKEIIVSKGDKRAYYEAAILYIAYGGNVSIRFAKDGEESNIDIGLVRDVCPEMASTLVGMMLRFRIGDPIIRSGDDAATVVKALADAIKLDSQENGYAIKKLIA